MSGEGLRGAFQGNERKVLTPFAPAHLEFKADTRMSADEGSRPSAWRSSRPAGSRLETRSATSRSATKVDLVWSVTGEGLMRTIAVVPRTPGRELGFDGGLSKRNQNKPPSALGLEGTNQSFHNSDAPVSTHCAEAMTDPSSAAPARERVCYELDAFVRDEMIGRVTGLGDDAGEECSDLGGGRFLSEDLGAEEPTREVIDCDGNPPAEGPDLRKSERQPGDPEPERGWDGRHVDIPNMIRSAGGDNAAGGRQRRRGRGLGRRPEHAPNGSWPEVKTSATKDVCDPGLAHQGAKHLEATDEIGNEVREPVDGLRRLDERVGPLLVEAGHPGGHGGGSNKKAFGGLGLRPSARSSQFQDCQSLHGRVVGPALCGDLLHPCVLDAHFLAEQDNLLSESVVLFLESDPSVDAVRGNAAGMGQGRLGQRDCMDDGGANLAGPFPREGCPAKESDSNHGSLREVCRAGALSGPGLSLGGATAME
jgi:hypothetical protein